MTPAIEVNKVYKHFGVVDALLDINLKIEQGEFFALLGPNGAGKTTLINVLAGLIFPSNGIARILGHDVVVNYREARRIVGVVPQELVFDPFFTVREMLSIQSGYYGLRNNDNWIDEVLNNLGLSDKESSNMRTLSGGMKRRVLVAQALVHKPPVIILDEPTAGVDVELRQSLWNFIKQLNHDGHTIVLTTHYLDEAEALCSRIGMLKQGKIVALDSTKNLINTSNGCLIRLRLSPDILPIKLQSLVENYTDNCFILKINSYSSIEGVLATLRVEQIKILEMEVIQPDLENIFVQIMDKADDVGFE
ncbi:MAG: ABC transporter ATP-binding protein [Nitrosomonadaceae bacterium]|nr:ABC transporter ATP-binding protein [Nitrosomonadaceae bacterium]|tara:strand:+ start:1964 stop:2881 length:918 start_codon:yes stop_codon:yes gene_type:complete